jgi:hypothetical protein
MGSAAKRSDQLRRTSRLDTETRKRDIHDRGAE